MAGAESPWMASRTSMSDVSVRIVFQWCMTATRKRPVYLQLELAW